MSAGAQTHRLASGGLIDRSQPLGFSFDGQSMTGYAGDTLASALIANGVKLVGRSFKYHRPRGILTAGSEEPNALVQLFEGTRTVPNARMTEVELAEGLCARAVNASPSVEFDLRAVNSWLARLLPAGFYYKTFMASQAAWHFFEKHIRASSGLGVAPAKPDPDCYEKRFAHCDVLVVGAGIAGLAAALTAGAAGARVIPLQVAGAFHTRFMEPAVDTMREVASGIVAEDPQLRIWTNRDGSVVDDGPRYLELLVGQIASPVRWDLVMESFAANGVTGIVELAPAGALVGLAKRALKGLPTVAVKSPDDIPAAHALIDQEAAA